jgi:integration host factor subunit beta
MATITKKELVNRIAARTGQTKSVTKDVIQLFLDEIVGELGRGNRLEFREFGVFEIKERAARKAQNPRTLDKVHVPAKRVVKFKVGRSMREAVDRLGQSEEPAAETASGRGASPVPATSGMQPPEAPRPPA